MPADGVVPVSGTERGHDTRPGEIEQVARALYENMRDALDGRVPWDLVSESMREALCDDARVAIAALDAFRAGVPDVFR